MFVTSNPQQLREYCGFSSCIATIGNFDGVHRGHKELIRQTVQKAKEDALPAVAVTFTPHPSVFFGNTLFKTVYSENQKIEKLAELGLDALIVLPFDKKLSSESAHFFSDEILKKTLGVKHLFVGYDFIMGNDRVSADELEKHGFFGVTKVGAVIDDDIPVSSSRIRKAISDGDTRLAAKLLGCPFSVAGEVVHGEGRGGPLLGIPTANIEVGNDRAMLPSGVYATSARIVHGGDWMPSVTSFCNNPTFGGSRLTLETHILDFDRDIYGREIEVCFLDRLRQEKKFDSLDSLIRQLHADMEQRKQLPVYI